MNIIERTTRIILTIILFSFGLYFLYVSLFSFWVAGGPPNDHKEAWLIFAMKQFYSAYFLFLLSIFMQIKSQRLFKSWIAGIFFILAVAGFAYPYIKEFLLIDSCLDSGGAWNYQTYKCEY